MAQFEKDFLKFFKELEKNNNKDWFDKNRKRYETVVREPFKRFMAEMASVLQECYPKADLSDKHSMMRINRDIRFSKDKTPYKIHMGGMVSPRGKKDKTTPGFYVQANHNDIRVYSGAWMVDKEQLADVRHYIKDHLKEFNKLISAKPFVDTFGEILGEKNKRIPPEFKEAEKEQPLIANKYFYWFFKLDPVEILSDDLPKKLMKNYKKSMPLNQFFERALYS